MEYIRTLSRQFEAGDEAELLVENRSGTVSVRGDDTREVRIEVVARLWADDEAEADEQADLIGRGIRCEGNKVSVRAPKLLRTHPLFFFGRGPRVDYQIATPKRTAADIMSRTGRVEVERLERPLKVDSRTGQVIAREIAGDVNVLSRTGTVQLESVDGAAAIDSRTGTVRVQDCSGDVQVLSRSGALQLEEVGGKLTVETRTGSVRYTGEVRGDFDIEVTTGSVRLAVDPSNVFFLDAETRTGSVRSDLPLRRPGGGAPGGGQAPTVRVRARTGSIHIGAR